MIIGNDVAIVADQHPATRSSLLRLDLRIVKELVEEIIEHAPAVAVGKLVGNAFGRRLCLDMHNSWYGRIGRLGKVNGLAAGCRVSKEAC
ncbi:MAG: hypothetical protein ACK55I_43265, partial [bacterium]